MKKTILALCSLLVALAVQAKQTEVSVARDWGTMHGTLTVPEAGSDVVAIIIAGSGPTDRNGNSRLGVATNSYYFLTQALEEEGIATLRYDKQASGASHYADPEFKYESVRFEDFIADTEAWVAYLKEAGWKKIVLVGHSEGSLIALVAATETPDVAAVVSISGAGIPVGDILSMQLSNQLLTYNPGMIVQVQSILSRMKKGHTVPENDIPQELRALFNSSVQPFLISQMQYDPREVIRRVQQPVIVIGGGNDIQITPDNAQTLADAQPKAELRIIDGMTHVLKVTSETDMKKQMTTVYMNGDLPISEELVATVVKFILNV